MENARWRIGGDGDYVSVNSDGKGRKIKAVVLL
jgi:hypothetical protein